MKRSTVKINPPNFDEYPQNRPSFPTTSGSSNHEYYGVQNSEEGRFLQQNIPYHQLQSPQNMYSGMTPRNFQQQQMAPSDFQMAMNMQMQTPTQQYPPQQRSGKKHMSHLHFDEEGFDKEDPSVEKLRQRVKELEKKVKDYEKDLKVEKEKGQILNSQVDNLENVKKNIEIELKDKEKVVKEDQNKLQFLQKMKEEITNDMLTLEGRHESGGLETADSAKRMIEIKHSQSFITRFCNVIYKALDLTFLLNTKTVKRLQLHYDNTISQYFEFLWILLNANFLSIFGLLYIIITLIVDNKSTFSESNSYFLLSMSFSQASYSRRIGYGLNIFLMSVTLFIVFFYKYARMQIRQLKSEYQEGYSICNLAFGTWSWDHPAPRESSEKKHAFQTRTRIEIGALDFERREYEGRTREVYIRRTLGVFLLLCLLFSEWVLSIFLLSQNGLAKVLSEAINVPILSEIIVGLIVSLISWAIAWCAKLSTNVDLWPDEKSKNWSALWRLFISKIVFAIFAAFIEYQTIYPSIGNAGYTVGLVFSQTPYYDSTHFVCPEDHFIYKMIGLIIGEFMTGVLKNISMQFIYRLCMKRLNPNYRRRPGFNIERRISQVCVIQLYIWILYPYLPFACVLGTVLMLMIFYLEYLFVKKLTTPPEIPVPQAHFDWFMKQAYSLTLILYCLFFLMSYMNTAHNLSTSGALCGPYSFGEAMHDPIIQIFKDNNFTNFFVDLLSNIGLLYLVIFLLAYRAMMLFVGKGVLKELYDLMKGQDASQKKRLASKVGKLKEKFSNTRRKISMRIREATIIKVPGQKK